MRQFEVGSSGLFVLSSLVSGPFSVNTETFIGNTHFCLNTCVECMVCTDQLKMNLFYVQEGKASNALSLFVLSTQAAI